MTVRNPDYFVDGQPLDDLEWRWRLLRATGMPAAAGKRTAQLSLLQRPGVVVRRGAFDVGSLKVVVLLPEVGVREGLPVEAFDWRLSQLQSLLLRAATVERVTAGGLFLQARVVDVTLSDPAEVSRGRWQVEAVFRLDPFWVEVPGLVRGAVLVGGRPVVVGSPGFVSAPQGTYTSVEGGTVASEVAGMVEVSEFSPDDLEAL